MLFRRRFVLLIACAALVGCQGWQSALDTHGPIARSLEDLFWIFLGVLTAIWIATMVALLWSLRRRRAEGDDPLMLRPATERRMGVVVAICVGLSLVVVTGLTGLSYGAQKRLFSLRDGTLTLKVTGHQWWWEVIYEDPEPHRSFTTANEIHIPVGEAVRIKLESADVIHSFWVPSLAGKQDAITGRQNVIWVQADRPGIYRGQCTEFCGWQHAHMGLVIVAEAKEDFERWRDDQIAAAGPPADPERRLGMEIFLSKPCIMCHQVRGTPAGGRVGPDLTHVGSRLYIGAGTLPMNRGTLAAWIVDPHGIKPGVQMPSIQLAPDEIHPLVSYLEGLK
jgi:cytochrome c oxidase subunit 2